MRHDVRFVSIRSISFRFVPFRLPCLLFLEDGQGQASLLHSVDVVTYILCSLLLIYNPFFHLVIITALLACLPACIYLFTRRVDG